MASIFKKIAKEADSAGVSLKTKEARQWFYRRLRKMTNITPNKILNDELVLARRAPLIGRMFMFLYDPKYKETLPYYDKFPLIFMVEPAAGGFYGLNLHYLHPTQRALFFDAISELETNKKYDATTRLRLTYNLLAGSRKYRAFAPCFKHYLFEHVKSKVVQILPREWEIALFLPTESFQKKSKQVIWNISKEQTL